MATRWPSVKYKKAVHRLRQCICSGGVRSKGPSVKKKKKRWGGCCQIRFEFVGCVQEKMEQAESVGARQSEDCLLWTLTEAMRELEAVSLLHSCCGRGADERRRCGDGMHEEQDGGVAAATGAQRRCMQNILVVLKELSVSHTVRVAAWRDALLQCVHVLANQPLGGSKHQPQLTDGTEAFLKALK